MGVWGSRIEDDDLVADVLSAFDERLKSGDSIAAATDSVLSQFAESLDDEDERSLIWIAVAQAQWSYGELQPSVLQNVQQCIRNGEGLNRWNETGDAAVRSRIQLLNAFLEKMEKPNPKTKRLPKSIIRKPVFQPGTCLSIKLSNGQYGAAIVLAADHTKPEYGMNLIGVLRYMSSSPPQLPDFLERNWLRLTHHKWQGAYDVNWYLPVGFRKTQSRITVVGKIPITQTDPLKSETYTRWQEIGEQIIFQTDWEMNHK